MSVGLARDCRKCLFYQGLTGSNSTYGDAGELAGDLRFQSVVCSVREVLSGQLLKPRVVPGAMCFGSGICAIRCSGGRSGGWSDHGTGDDRFSPGGFAAALFGWQRRDPERWRIGAGDGAMEPGGGGDERIRRRTGRGFAGGVECIAGGGQFLESVRSVVAGFLHHNGSAHPGTRAVDLRGDPAGCGLCLGCISPQPGFGEESAALKTLGSQRRVWGPAFKPLRAPGL